MVFRSNKLCSELESSLQLESNPLPAWDPVRPTKAVREMLLRHQSETTKRRIEKANVYTSCNLAPRGNRSFFSV